MKCSFVFLRFSSLVRDLIGFFNLSYHYHFWRFFRYPLKFRAIFAYGDLNSRPVSTFNYYLPSHWHLIVIFSTTFFYFPTSFLARMLQWFLKERKFRCGDITNTKLQCFLLISANFSVLLDARRSFKSLISGPTAINLWIMNYVELEYSCYILANEVERGFPFVK